MVSISKLIAALLLICPALYSQANLPSGTTASGTLNFKTIAAPSTPASGRLLQWADSTSKLICGKNDAGTLSCTVIPSSATSHQFFNSLSAGVFGSAQPAFTDISGTLGCAQFPTISGDASNSSCAFTITALHLSPTPTLCSSGNYARGIDANGNATGCAAAGTGSAASTIQSNSLKGNTVTTGSITTGHLVVVGIDSDNGSVDPPVLSSTRVPSWTLACKSVANSNKAWLFYGKATSSGTDSISSTVAGSFSGTSYLEISGANAIKDACNAVYSNVAGISSTFSTTFLNDVVVSFWAGWHVGECVTAISPMVTQSSNCAAPADPLAIGSFTTTSAGSQTAAFNSTGGLDDNQIMLTAAFTSSNSAVGVAPYYQTDQANGSALSQELINDFISGTGITVSGADDSANTRSKFTFDLANTAVSAGTYGDSTHSLTATVNAQGQLTAISTNTIPGAGTATYAQLCSGTISSSTATLQFDTTHNCSGAHPFTSTYNYYDIRCDHITPTSGSNTFFVFRVATVGGYDSGANYGYSVVQANGATNFNNQFGGDSAQTSIALTGAMTSTNNGGSGELQVNNPLSSTTFKFFNSNFGTFDQGGHWYVNPGSGRYLSNTALQDIEFLFTTGNIATATCTIWGRP